MCHRKCNRKLFWLVVGAKRLQQRDNNLKEEEEKRSKQRERSIRAQPKRTISYSSTSTRFSCGAELCFSTTPPPPVDTQKHFFCYFIVVTLFCYTPTQNCYWVVEFLCWAPALTSTNTHKPRDSSSEWPGMFLPDTIRSCMIETDVTSYLQTTSSGQVLRKIIFLWFFDFRFVFSFFFVFSYFSRGKCAKIWKFGQNDP